MSTTAQVIWIVVVAAGFYCLGWLRGHRDADEQITDCNFAVRLMQEALRDKQRHTDPADALIDLDFLNEQREQAPWQ